METRSQMSLAGDVRVWNDLVNSGPSTQRNLGLSEREWRYFAQSLNCKLPDHFSGWAIRGIIFESIFWEWHDRIMQDVRDLFPKLETPAEFFDRLYGTIALV